MLVEKNLYRRGWYLLGGLVLLLSIGLTASGAFASSPKDTTTQLVHAPALTDTPTPTNTPSPCAEWSAVSSPNPSNYSYLSEVAAVSANDVWAVGHYFNSSAGQTLVEHWDGTSWSLVSSPNPGTSYNFLDGVAAVSANDVWAVGNYQNNGSVYQTLVEHWDGTSWSVVSSPNVSTSYSNYLLGVAVVSANDVWAVGHAWNQTLIEHWNGTAWSVVPSSNPGTSGNYLQGVAAVSANDVWAVGEYSNGGAYQTLIEHWNGTSWSVVSSPNGRTDDFNHLYGVAAVSANDVWAVGYYNNGSAYQTLVEHWNGTEWSVVPSPDPSYNTLNQLYGVTAVSANDVWAVGWYWNGSGIGRTLVEHWNGTVWSLVSSPNVGMNDNALNGIAVVSANDVWAVGNYTNGSGSQTLVEHHASPCATPTSTSTNTPIPTNTATSTPTNTRTPRPIHFTDVHTEEYFYEAVRFLADRGAISGYNDDTFRPYDTTSRAQLAKIVVIALQVPIDTTGRQHFADVPNTPDNPLYSFIEAAYNAGIVRGYDCGVAPDENCDAQHRPYYRPGNPITRGQLSKIVVLAMGWATYTTGGPHFADVPNTPDNPFYSYIETAYHKGIISGYRCGEPGEDCDTQNRPYFRPADYTVRGQIAKIVYQAILNR